VSATPLPEKCPKCGENLFHEEAGRREFECFTLILRGGEIYEGGRCAKNQRDQLEAKLKLLTAAGRDAMDFINGIHREYSRVIEGWEKATK